MSEKCPICKNGSLTTAWERHKKPAVLVSTKLVLCSSNQQAK